MKKLNLHLASAVVLLMLVVACERRSEKIAGPKVPENTSLLQQQAEISIVDVKKILEAAQKDVPIEAGKGITIGVLERERGSESCLVLYDNQSTTQVYRFEFTEMGWKRGSLMKHEKKDLNSMRLNKLAVIPSPIAKVWGRSSGTVIDSREFDPSWGAGYYYLVFDDYSENIGAVLAEEGKGIINYADWDIDFQYWVFPFCCTGTNLKYYQIPLDKTASRADAVYYIYELKLPPSTPTLSSPANNSYASGTTVTFRWNTSNGNSPVLYHIQISRNTAFTDLFVDEYPVSATSKTYSGFSEAQPYYWRVRAVHIVNGVTVSGLWPTYWTINIPKPASAPTLLSPSNGGCPPAPTTFSWAASQGTPPITYTLQVDDQNDFVSLIYNQGSISGTSHTFAGLSNNATYYWRVIASNNYGSAISSISSFKILQPPTNAYITGNVGGLPRVNWTASTSLVSNYKLYRKGTNTSWSLVATTSATNWVDSQITIQNYGTATDYYTYKVTAISTVGCESVSSNQPGTYGKPWSIP